MMVLTGPRSFRTRRVMAAPSPGAAGAAIIAALAGGPDPGPPATPLSTAQEAAGAAAGQAHYVAPKGTALGRGTIANPWDLATALSGADGRVRPGDTVWVRGGRYPGDVVSTLAGAPGRHVVVRAMPGERAILDGAGATNPTLTVEGAWAMYWGLELTNSDGNRTQRRPNVVYNRASHTRYVNLIIHDGGVAFYTDPTPTDIEISGCIIYNNGWEGPGWGFGHGLYVQSNAGPVVAHRNILFNQFGYGIHAYSDRGSGRLVNIRFEGNVAFNNGTLSTKAPAANILVGGRERADRIVVSANRTFFSPGVRGANVRLGYDTLTNGAMSVRDNVLVGGSPVLHVGYWATASVTANRLGGTGLMVDLHDPDPLDHAWAGNRYERDPEARGWRFVGVAYSFAAWRTRTGLGGMDVALAPGSRPPDAVVHADPYEPGRASITVYNAGRQGAVTVDLSGVLAPGDAYEVRNVQDLFGPPVASGSYDGGGITLPMSGVPPPTPVGMTASPAPRTGPLFDVFLVNHTPAGATTAGG